MLCRVAESVYWMSRYIERAENVARFIMVNLNLSLDLPGDARTQSKSAQWWPLVVSNGDDQLFLQRYDIFTRENVIQFLTFDGENPNSILSCLAAARENARVVRETISVEMWEHINNCYLKVRDCGGLSAVLDNPYKFFSQINVWGQQFGGITDATMARGQGWHFSQLGRCLERADKTSRLVDVKYFILLPAPTDIGSPHDAIQWLALLRSASALAMYRQRHGRVAPGHVVELLILDRDVPRAVLFCLEHARESLHAVSHTRYGGEGNVPEQLLDHLHADLAHAKAEEIISGGLHEFVDDLQRRLNRVCDAVYETFFAAFPLDSSLNGFSGMATRLEPSGC
jgi:uncharacterized alpha-E superfamily protein